MRFRLRLALALVALATAIWLAPGAAAQPRATQLEKVQSVVEPGIIYLDIKWSGIVDGKYVIEDLPSRCTGFFVTPEGHFVTAAHCVDRPGGREALIQAAYPNLSDDELIDAFKFASVRSLEVPARRRPDLEVVAAYGVDYGGLPTGRGLPVRVLGLRAPEKGDVAVGKIEAENVPVLELAPEADIDVGTKVVSVGYPQTVDFVTDPTFDPSFKEGSISAVKTRNEGLFSVYEISAAVSGGMSGGPTVDLRGRVVGVNSFGIRGEPQPFNFISPASEVVELLADKGVDNQLGQVDRDYRAGLAAFYAGERAEAIESFDAVLGQVQEHEFAQEFRAQALRLPQDEDDGGGFPTWLLIVLILLAIAGAAVAVWLLRRRPRAPVAAGARGPAPDKPVTALVVSEGAREGERFDVPRELVIGRDADITIDDGEVSRRHASVKPVAEGLVLTDLGSANGTLVNGERVDRSTLLADGDVLTLGATSLIVDSPAARAAGRTRMRKSDDALAGPALLVNEGPLKGERFQVDRELTVGRAGADITVHDPEVSRQHARVRPVNGGVEVTDLGSVNGTAVNGVRIERPTPASDGDVIRFGKTSITVVGSDGRRPGGQTLPRRAQETTPRP